MALGLIGLPISCMTAASTGGAGLTLAAGLLLVGILLRLSTRRPQPDPDTPSASTHVRCPECRELVRHDASKCKHCGATLTPGPTPSASPRSQGSWIKIVLAGALAGLVLLEWLRR